ncbi:MAG: gamma-glutamyltransferase, partial [bacterium]
MPGTVAGLWEAHRKYGRLPWRELVQPAIRLARDGFIPEAQLIRRVDESLPEYAGKTNFARYFGSIAKIPPGSKKNFRQPELARTLERIAQHGPA